MGVYGIAESDHVQLQSRRDDLPRLIAYLNERGLLFSINHAFSGLTGPRAAADFEDFSTKFPAVETLNGQMLAVANRYAAAFAERHGRIAIGGSDAHTLSSVGKTYTVVEGVRTPAQYLEGLEQGHSRVAGVSGDVWKLTTAVCGLGSSMVSEKPWTIMLTPWMAFVPAITIVNYLMELAFAAKWGARLGAAVKTPVSDAALVLR